VFFTLGNFIIDQGKDEDTADLSLLVQAIATSCKYIAHCVRKAGLAKLAGKAGNVNVQGEEQMTLDVIAHEVFVKALDQSRRCTVLVSEETPEIIQCKESPMGQYVCVFDPLDGSSNIACGRGLHSSTSQLNLSRF
jgi:fructose-1,6-bisphosphatase I